MRRIRPIVPAPGSPEAVGRCPLYEDRVSVTCESWAFCGDRTKAFVEGLIVYEGGWGIARSWRGCTVGFRLQEKLSINDLRQSSTPVKALLAASTGGHLAQLVRFERSWNTTGDSLWVTFDTPQSRSLLEGRRVIFVPYVKPRDIAGACRVARGMSRLLRRERFDIAVSTGAALAMGVLPVAAARGVPASYLESVSRVEGPSLTGRLLSASHLTELNTQHRTWSGGRWKQHPSVLAQFAPAPRTRSGDGPLKIFVTLGTIKPYRFDAMIDAMLRTGLANSSTVWQLGETSRSDLPGRAVPEVSADEFRSLALGADVVVTHAGVGTILNLLEWGVHPVVVPRRRIRNEHVDDHQLQIGHLVQSLGVAQVAEAPELQADQLLAAAELTNVERPSTTAPKLVGE